MLNNQVPSQIDRDVDGFLLVHSMFYTIQGEGPFAGHPAFFVRLFGCNLQCPFCDTDYTSKKEQMSPVAILNVIKRTEIPCKLIVITGGEPFRQNITPLVYLLLANEYKVQVESNGVLYPGDDFPWASQNVTVVVSPKTGKIHPETATKAHAYKYVLARDSVGTDGLPGTALAHPLGGYSNVARPPVGWDGPIYINPMDEQDPVANKNNMQQVAQVVMANPRFIMGVQMHKLVDLP